MSPSPAFVLPDTIASLGPIVFEFSPSARAGAAAILAAPPEVRFARLLREQESESTLLAARTILDAFLRPAAPPDDAGRAGEAGDAYKAADADEAHDADAIDDAETDDADAIAARVARLRDGLAAEIAGLAGTEDDVRHAVLRQRAPLALLGGCWLGTLSQPATQPSTIVNRLLADHFRARGEGALESSVHSVRRRALETIGVRLPDVEAVDFLSKADARPLTALQASFYLALSHLPASFLPEVVGVHYVFHALGVDDLLTATPARLAEGTLRASLAEYLELTRAAEDGLALRRRLAAAIEPTLTLERQHVAMLGELASWRGALSLDARVAEIVRRHGPFAGRQHRSVRIGGRLLSDALADAQRHVGDFMREFRASHALRPLPDGDCRFLRAIRFGGPMFGVFDEREAAILRTWAQAVGAGEPADVEISPCRVGDDAARRLGDAIAAAEPADVAFAEPAPLDDRALLHRLIHIERFPSTLPLARRLAARTFDEAEILFEHGAGGRYTDASYFYYSADALYARVDAIYWDKLVDPWQPLAEIPDRDAVLFGQKMSALGNLIDGAWAQRIGNRGRDRRRSDAMLFAIYADEMGRGDLRKNHITLIHQVLGSMAVRLPHIRDAAFLEQDELPDTTYGFAIHQLAMSLFPDSFYNEILGYNLAIEMYGLGELRMHEMQKLRRHGFDISYEEAHLSIDNVSAGHAKQSADIVVAYLDDLGRGLGDEAVQREWRRIWRGYASFASFIERGLVKRVSSAAAAGAAAAPPQPADLLI